MIRISHQRIGARFKTSIRSFLRNNYINMIIVCIYVSFLSFWEGLFEAYACPLTGSLVCNAVTEIIWAVLLCCIGRKCWTEFKCGVLIGDKKLFASITVIGLWIWYRFKSDSFVLYALPDIPFFRYVDVMLVIGLSIIIQRFFSNKHVFPLEGDGFLTDNPIDNIDDDVLNRKEDAKAAIYKILLTPTVESAFTFGVVAPWGEGKTSFLNMMKHHISSLGTQSITIMDFNPWLYDNDANLTKSFFTELQSTLSPYNASMVKNINAYMKVLSIAEDKLQTIQNMFTTSAMDVVSTNLRTEMSRLDRKVVVFVDDIDRLNKDEILQVFKLVRNTSNFPNMYFILAYDRQYIIDSLGKQFAIQALHFTEKIMQEEFELMPATTDQLREELLRLFSAFLNDNEQKAIQSLLLGQNYYKFSLTDYVKTLREAKRLANSMYMNYIKMRGEVNVNDFLLYEIMKSCYPFVTRLIKSNMESLFILQNNERLFLIDGKRDPERESDLKYLNTNRINFEEYIKAQHDDLHLEEKDLICVMNLMSVLFGEYKQALVCSINNINYIHRYLLNNLLESDIQEKEYNQTMSLPFVQAKAQLTEWAHNQSRNLVVRLAKSDPQDKEHLKHVLRVMFYVNAISNKWNNDVYEIDRKIDKLKTFNYETLNYSEEDKFFVQQLLTENGYNSFVAKYIYNLFEHSSWDYLIDKDVIICIQTQFLKDVIKSNEFSAKVVFNCWNYSGNKMWVSKGNGYYTTHIEYPTKNNDLMKKYAESHLEDFIPLTFRYWSPNEYCNYGLNSATRILWGSYDNYYSYISNQENTPILKEYKEFLKKLKENGFGDDAEVHFVFKEISINV